MPATQTLGPGVPPPTVPMLSFPMLILLALALGGRGGILGRAVVGSPLMSNALRERKRGMGRGGGPPELEVPRSKVPPP